MGKGDEQRMTRKLERRVVRAAMLCWKYEPVSSALVGYSRRWDNLMKVCAALSRKECAHEWVDAADDKRCSRCGAVEPDDRGDPAGAAPMPEEPTPLKLWRSREPIGSIWREIADYADTLRARCEELQQRASNAERYWHEQRERAERAERDRATLAAAVREADNLTDTGTTQDGKEWTEKHAEALRLAREALPSLG